MDDDQQFCLRWNNHQSTLISVFDTLLENGTLVDCTLAAEGKFLKAHKVVLCACSPYFASLLSQQYDKHPIFILKDVKFQELRAMMDYMYRGEVNISQDQLAALLKAAESLQIKGLSDNRSGSSAKGGDSAQQQQQQKQQVPVSGGAAGSAAKTGLTIEQNNKRPNAELPGDREGSTSPLSRKRKRVRRRSVDTNNAATTIDNHDQMSNSSSQSATQQAQPITSTPLTLSQITTATSAANVLNVTKKTDNHSNDDDDDDDEEEEEEEPTIVRHKTRNTDGSNKDKIETELLIEPKSEYEDGNDEAVEDLTMADEDLMDDMEQAGPSHGGEGSSQGYAQWQVDRSQDDVYLATQESVGQHRDAQEHFSGLKLIKIERSPSPIIILPSLSSVQNANNQTGSRLKVSRQGVQSWQLNNSHVNRRSVQQQKMLTALKSAGARRGQFALFASTIGSHRNKSIKTTGKSAVISPMTSRSSASANAVNANANANASSTQNGNETPTRTNTSGTSSGNTTSNSPTNSKALKRDIKRDSLTSSTDMLFNEGDEKPWSCKVCKRQYKWKNSLNCHIKNECGKPPKFFCERMCGYKTNIHSNMKRHMNSNCKPRFLQ
ncbi:longitudinals lacking protein, isoforms J/P/Q/S/Z-like isoform X5 [Sitodiplosis mosellana]|uniref:longitudinals lacking protein, isoforms J/P/Q/S/Z-like isoform X5 n=1 Tax=Sitodiplosis mosellana TaxID=263140 RepID=UPI00244461DD|nr:longitudinals lacking protein, isoforms J/P/Q/S/Z-like isoform X5 [Sitodiplosis mosellana]XP_055320644.1 longitudinals lacking protein, isoforms J/P/Q/S/Z-like isoform X5 [Sitodiplosis mosellana]XP_055320645.1 longitudinals lacking protein, isoforms J/P/Q/S/Z-like isoform X5 [Sitodiplosis mosellana]XP_055320646.1 longitudinals lacking protein, isoforms J/P/Q/S/Z-like isoform X5 [Sitodiplosis mosellana]XP_055320647.1 longitudinals lacking protein, isoforms J/P/Q/S/Z-like isoform X5 [Sitodiplo